jgi:hypothetical protein
LGYYLSFRDWRYFKTVCKREYADLTEVVIRGWRKLNNEELNNL